MPFTLFSDRTAYWDLSVASIKILSRIFRFHGEWGGGWSNRPDLPGFENLAGLSPADLVGAEHFTSTSVPRLSAKPIADILVEVFSLERTNKEIAPVLE
jgi:hypothetical protein